jgi:hypothetical protein
VFARHLVESAVLGDGVLDLSVRLNWYRSLPLCCVERLEVSLDGVPLAPEGTTLTLGAGTWTVPGLAGADGTWWPVLDTARVRVALGAVPDDGPHVVELLVGTRIPYLVDPDGHAAVIVDRARAEVAR